MKGTSGLRIGLQPVQDKTKLHSAALGIPAGLLVLSGLSLTVSSWFPSAGVSPWGLWLGMAALFLALTGLALTTRVREISLGLLVAVAVGCMVCHKQVMGGLGCLANDLNLALTRATGTIHLDYAAAGASSGIRGLVPLAAVWVILLHYSLYEGKIFFALPVLLPVYAALALGLYPVDGGAVLLTLGILLMLMRCASIKAGDEGWWGRPTWAALLAVCILAALPVSLAAGDEAAVSEAWRERLHTLVYHRESNSMPEGKLKNLSSWKKTNTPALKVTMSQPQKLYLRGQVYESYDGSAWTLLSGEEAAEAEDLFYWLHKSGFYGQSQVGAATALISGETPAELKVENLSACSAHGYSPYALAGNESLDPQRVGDNRFLPEENLRYYPGSVPRWYEVQHMLAASQEDGEVAGYLVQEDAYEAYITDTCLQLTNESWSVLNRQLGQETAPQSLSQIRNLIRKWLEDNLVYDEEVKTLSGENDFLQYTLEGSGSGYNVHFATAATLMLRYYGVPARYVEGYFLSAEEAAAFQPGEEILLTEKHAHAWAEYYLPGVGFIPFEVTPGYVDDEEDELGGRLAQNEHTYTGEHLKYAQVEQPERIEEPQQDRFGFTMKPIYLVYLLLVGLCVLAVIVILRRRRFRAALRGMEEASDRESIALRYGYAVALLHSCGEPDVEGSREAQLLNREALFSNHPMTRQQREEMDAFACRVLNVCKEKWTIPQKLRYRLWDCLY